jgi:hypothetical protein
MGKRSSFIRKERDFYPTPYEAITPLLPHLNLSTHSTFCEPCAGDGTLIDHLTKHKHICKEAWDIEPKRFDIKKMDALRARSTEKIDYFITNPPWDRKILHPLIDNLTNQYPTWLLFDSDWMHTKQSKEYMNRCHKIVSIGRLKWIPNSKMTGKDNCCWYLFNALPRDTVFYGR